MFVIATIISSSDGSLELALNSSAMRIPDHDVAMSAISRTIQCLFDCIRKPLFESTQRYISDAADAREIIIRTKPFIK